MNGCASTYFGNFFAKPTVIWMLFLIASMIINCNSRQQNKDNNGANSKNEATKPNEMNQEKKTIVFFGNSLTAGYGLDVEESFPSLIQKKIDSAGLPYKVINAGISGETTAGGKNRVEWVLRQKVDVFVLELGANDGLRGISLDQSKSNLQEIINKVKSKYPEAKIILAGMHLPPNMGPEYTARFSELYPALARENNIYLIPFLLQGVGGELKYNQADGIHPTAEGYQIVAENVWAVLKDVL